MLELEKGELPKYKCILCGKEVVIRPEKKFEKSAKKGWRKYKFERKPVEKAKEKSQIIDHKWHFSTTSPKLMVQESAGIGNKSEAKEK